MIEINQKCSECNSLLVRTPTKLVCSVCGLIFEEENIDYFEYNNAKAFSDISIKVYNSSIKTKDIITHVKKNKSQFFRLYRLNLTTSESQEKARMFSYLEPYFSLIKVNEKTRINLLLEVLNLRKTHKKMRTSSLFLLAYLNFAKANNIVVYKHELFKSLNKISRMNKKHFNEIYSRSNYVKFCPISFRDEILRHLLLIDVIEISNTQKEFIIHECFSIKHIIDKQHYNTNSKTFVKFCLIASIKKLIQPTIPIGKIEEQLNNNKRFFSSYTYNLAKVGVRI